MGSRRAALMAGNMPDATPMAAEKKKEATIAMKGIDALASPPLGSLVRP